MTSAAGACNVRVLCRFRPVNKREIAEGGDAVADNIQFSNDNTGVSVMTAKGALPFTLDHVFRDANQVDVYKNAAKESIEDVLSGFNATIFAYGQTGSGKSWTMFGPTLQDSDLQGIIPRAVNHIFTHIEGDVSGTEYTIKCSFLEIYKEEVKDLLQPTSRRLRVRENPSRGVWVDGLTEEFVTSQQDVMGLLELGERHRSTASTQMNDVSSRSHSLFVLTLVQKATDGSVKSGKLNLADLAGSESVRKTGATGSTLEEAKKINQSLSALGNCIYSLTKDIRGHVPYRDSKLTFILKESLGGNTKTTLLVACSPHAFNLEETVGTLRFAQRAKTIKNTVHVNQKRSVEELEKIVQALLAEVARLKAYAALLETQLGPEADLSALLQQAKAGGAAAVADAGKMPQLTMDGMAKQVKLEQLKDEVREEVAELQYELKGVQSQLADRQKELHSFQKDYEALADKEKKYVYEAQQLALELESEKEAAKLSSAKLSEAKVELDGLRTKLRDSEMLAETWQAKVEENTRLTGVVELELTAAQQSLAELRSSLAESEARTAEQKQLLEDAQDQLSGLAKEKEDWKQQVQKSKLTVKELRVQLDRAEQEKQLLESSLRSSLEAERAKYASLERRLTSKEKEAEDVVSSISDQSAQLQEANLRLETELVGQRSELQQALLEKQSVEEQFSERQLSHAAEIARLEDEQGKTASALSELKTNFGSLREVLQRTMKQKKQQEQEHETAMASQVAVFKKTMKQRDEDAQELSRQLASAARDLEESQKALDLSTKHSAQSEERISDLEAQMAEKNNLLSELKEDVQAAVQLNIENAAKFQEELMIIEQNHQQASEHRKAVIVRSIVAEKTGTPDQAEPYEREVTSSWWSSRKLPTMKDIGSSALKGWLNKQGGWVKSWQRRFCLLKGNALFYFETAESERPRGVIEMGSDCIVQEADEYTGHPNSFGLFHTKGKVFYFFCETSKDRDHWVESCNKMLLKSYGSRSAAPVSPRNYAAPKSPRK